MSSNTLTMAVRTALRSFERNRIYVFINVFALSVAMTCAILAYVNLHYSLTFDGAHANLDQLYVLRSVTAADKGNLRVGISPRPVGPALLRDVPEIRRMARIVYAEEPIKHEERVFNEVVYYVDPAFLEMFTLPLVAGAHDALSDVRSIALTEKTAKRYFGTEDALGKVVTITTDSGQIRSYRVAAVLSDLPSNSSIQFDALLPYAARDRAEQESGDWNVWSHETILQTAAPNIATVLAPWLDKYVQRQHEVHPDVPLARMEVESMGTVAEHSRELSNDIFKETMHPAAVVAPTVTAILLLLTACINFMNTSLAFSAQRLKEVGIRKVLGSGRHQLVAQFIGENLLLCLVSLLIAASVAVFLVPAYDSLWPDWDFSLNVARDWGIFVFLLTMLVVMSVASGAYPSILLSRFSPVEILAGRQRFRGNHWLMRMILLVQFTVSALTVLTGIVFTANADFISKFNMGFDTKRTVVVQLQGRQVYDALRNEASHFPGVESVSGARHVVGYDQSMRTLRFGGTERRVAVMDGSEEYLPTLDMKLVQGRFFDRNIRSDRTDAVIVSEKCVKEFGWTQPLGQRVFVDSLPYTVVGVVQDAYNRGVWRPLQPSAFRITDQEKFRYVVLRAAPGQVAAVADFMRDAWHRAAPNTPFEVFYGSDAVAGALGVSRNIRLVFIVVSGVAIAIAAMGLFALSSLVIVKRTKEIGIRKVLGASVFHLVRILNAQLFTILAASAIIAGAGGYFLMGMFLDSLYVYHIVPQVWHYLLSGAIIIFIGLLTVSSQVYRVATGNPVVSLRYE